MEFLLRCRSTLRENELDLAGRGLVSRASPVLRGIAKSWAVGHVRVLPLRGIAAPQLWISGGTPRRQRSSRLCSLGPGCNRSLVVAAGCMIQDRLQVSGLMPCTIDLVPPIRVEPHWAASDH